MEKLKIRKSVTMKGIERSNMQGIERITTGYYTDGQSRTKSWIKVEVNKMIHEKPKMVGLYMNHSKYGR